MLEQRLRSARIEFKDFPASYRFCQRSMLTVCTLLFAMPTVFAPRTPDVVKMVVGVGFGLVVLAALLISSYVVARYPYLSLVCPKDGDHLDQQTSRLSPPLVRILRFLGLACCIMMVAFSAIKGIETVPQAVVVVYAATLIPVLVFLILWYDPVSYPTLATLSRATFGVGLLFVPLYLPVLAMGAAKCRRLVAGRE